MRKKAIATLVIGEAYQRRFSAYVERPLRAYAQANGFDLFVLDQPLDTSDRAKSRSPSWQKCLIFQDSKIADYERVVWLDSDIIINPKSPDITDGVPLDALGAVNETAFCNPTLMEMWKAKGAKPIEGDIHLAYGLPASLPKVVQGGVLVVSPQRHRNIFKDVYRKYEEKSQGFYEMQPLSYELQTRSHVHWLDPRFNAMWIEYQALHCPATLYPADSTVKQLARQFLKRRHMKIALKRNYFLHFAAANFEMRLWAPILHLASNSVIGRWR